MIGENTEVGMVVAEEIIALIDKEEENTLQLGKTEETTGKKDKMTEEEIEEITLLKKAEGALAIIDEGVAKGPLVMEGPLQANP